MPHVTTKTTIDPKELGRRLRQAREEAGMSRAQLGERTGISDKVIQKIESGAQDPSVSRLVALCQAVDFPFHEMVGSEESGRGQDAPSQLLPDPATAPQTEPVDQVRELLDQLDGLREGKFENALRRPFAMADEGVRLLRSVEPGDLATLARERALHESDDLDTGKLLDAFEDSFTGAEIRTSEIAERVIDTGFFGLDLYRIEIKALHDLGERFVDDDVHGIETPGFLQSWGPHTVIVPELRLILRRMAVIGQGLDFSNAEEFPQRESG